MEPEKPEDQNKAEETAQEEPMPQLNRAERRAMEHHKKGGAKPGSSPNGLRGEGFGVTGMRGGGHANSHLPRTGHK